MTLTTHFFFVLYLDIQFQLSELEFTFFCLFLGPVLLKSHKVSPKLYPLLDETFVFDAWDMSMTFLSFYFLNNWQR